MESNDNITRLLEMLDNPEAYSEQDIRDTILSDDETREAYRLMVAARQGYAHKQTAQTDDAETAWQLFAAKHYPKMPSRNRMKIAASFVGLLMISGIAFATIRLAQNSGHGSTRIDTDTVEIRVNPMHHAKQSEAPADTAAVQPVVYDNIPLETMLHEIAGHYAVEVRFQSDEARGLRFHFVWNPQQEIEEVVADLNHFERLHVTLKDNLLIVE